MLESYLNELIRFSLLEYIRVGWGERERRMGGERQREGWRGREGEREGRRERKGKRGKGGR